MKFIKLTTVYYKDTSWHDGDQSLFNSAHIVRVYPNKINGDVKGSFVDTINDHTGYSIKVKETTEEIEEMLK